jgi:hypothetical protein
MARVSVYVYEFFKSSYFHKIEKGFNMNIFNSVEVIVRSIEQNIPNEKDFIKTEIRYHIVNNNENSNKKIKEIKEIIENLSEVDDIIITEKEEIIDLIEYIDDIFNF